jgi:hypothetical protein
MIVLATARHNLNEFFIGFAPRIEVPGGEIRAARRLTKKDALKPQ